MHLRGGRLAAALVAFFVLIPAARADEARLSIGGYDPVAYFTDRRPVQGKAEFAYLWHDLRWLFASEAHRGLFIGNPERYAPQYDGYCAMGASAGAEAHKDTVDPKAWAIVDGKLYLTHNRYWLQKWQENAEAHVRQADHDWTQVKNLPAPEIVGPPCASFPASTRVALRGGGHWIVVGGQVARDGAGKLVGKGDMRAQIEQVGRNVGACLEAGGATVKDVLWTVNYVTQPAEFERYADLRLHYFGPPSANSATVSVPQLPGPDFLLQVEAFARTK